MPPVKRVRSRPDQELELPSGRASARRSSGLRSIVARLGRRLARESRPRQRARIATPLATASSRRVVVKVRVVQLGTPEQKQRAKLHFGYLEREGVERDGTTGVAYDGEGRLERAAFDQDIEEEKHQFRLVISPEDGTEIELESYVRRYMARVEEDVGRRLLWVAVNHYNTDHPHAHVVIRGVDADGRELRLDEEYISHGLRHRAAELATQELGPVPALERRARLAREAELLRVTSLDADIERRAVDGVFRERARDRLGRHRNPHRDGALRRRLEVLEGMGLARWKGKDEWQLAPNLRDELWRMQRYGEALARIREVVSVDPSRCRVIDRDEPSESDRKALAKGVRGVLRWKGLDEAGRFCAIIETVGGEVYHLPAAPRAVDEARVGQVVDLKRAVDKDERIEKTAQKNDWRYDLEDLPEEYRDAYQKRLEQLERMKVATRESDQVWKLDEDFRGRVNDGKPQPYWQMLSILNDSHPLSAQRRFLGSVWLDRVKADELGPTGFGEEVRNAQAVRHEYLRELGLDPTARDLQWKLRDLQQEALERQIAASTGRVPLRPYESFEGVVQLHRKENGQRFIEIRTPDHFVVMAAGRSQEKLHGQEATITKTPDDKGLRVAKREAQQPARQARDQQALAQCAALAPDAVRHHVIDGGPPATGVNSELERGLRGIVRWVGADEQGAARAVVETPSGDAYHLPLSARTAEKVRRGQIVEVQRAPGMDELLQRAARDNGDVYDLSKSAAAIREAHRRRLEQLERSRLATRVGDGLWKLDETFLGRPVRRQPRPVWLRADFQPIAVQRTYDGPVWLDSVRTDQLAQGGFGGELRAARLEREAHLRSLGLDPASERLRWQMLDRQQRAVGRAIVEKDGGTLVAPRSGFEGIVRMHRAENGERFVELRHAERVVVLPAPPRSSDLVGKEARIEWPQKARLQLVAVDRDRERDR